GVWLRRGEQLRSEFDYGTGYVAGRRRSAPVAGAISMAIGRRKSANATDRAGITGLVVVGLRGIDSRTLACLQNAFFRSSADAVLHRGPGAALQHGVRQCGADLPAAGAVVAILVDHRGCWSGAARITEIAQAPLPGRQPAAVAAEAGMIWETYKI